MQLPACSSGVLPTSSGRALLHWPATPRPWGHRSLAQSGACSNPSVLTGIHTGTSTLHTRKGLQAHASYSSDAYGMGTQGSSTASGQDLSPERMGEAARKALARATTAVKRYGWISFWVQLTLSVVSAVILLFSVAFTSQSGPRASLYLTLIGILAGFLSTFWNLGYTRTGLKMQRYLEAPPGANVQKVKKQAVVDMVARGAIINLLGLGSTLLGIQALVGVLVAKTLSNATANPFIASAAGVYNPVLALDVFLVQAATNMLLGHFLSLVCSLWLLSIVGEGRGLRFQRFLTLQRLRARAQNSKLVISKGNAGTFTIDADDSIGRGGRGGGGGGGNAARAVMGTLESARSRSVALLNAGRQPARTVDPPLISGAQTAVTVQAGVRGARAGWDLLPSTGPTVLQALTSSASAFAAYPPPVSGNTTQWGSKVRVGTPAPTAPAGPVPVRVKRSSGKSLDKARSALGLAASKRATSGDMLVLADANSLSYLDGSLPGDMGFDPLGLFSPENPEVGFVNQRWLRYAEVIHGRWACLGVVGCLAPEILAYEGIIPKEHGVVWYKTGFLPMAGQYDFGMDQVSLTWIMLVTMAFAEMRRYQDFNKPGSLATGQYLPLVLERALSTPPGFDPVYPGGPIFNFMGVVETESGISLFKEKELKHGRLAMVAMLGLFAQAAATHDGPYINLLDHLFDPLGENVLTNLNDINE